MFVDLSTGSDPIVGIGGTYAERNVESATDKRIVGVIVIAVRGVDVVTLCHFEAGAGNHCVGGKCTARPLFGIRCYGQRPSAYMYKSWVSPSGSRCSGTGRTHTCRLGCC